MGGGLGGAPFSHSHAVQSSGPSPGMARQTSLGSALSREQMKSDLRRRSHCGHAGCPRPACYSPGTSGGSLGHPQVSLSGCVGRTHGLAQVSAHGLLSPLSLVLRTHTSEVLSHSRVYPELLSHTFFLLYILKHLSLQAEQGPAALICCSYTVCRDTSCVLGCRESQERPASGLSGPMAP